MKKVWEETWASDDGDLHVVDEKGKFERCAFEPSAMSDGKEQHYARAKLAATAPQLVRLLMWYEWRFNVNGYTPDGGCPACGESRLSGHASDCAYVALMAKAGVDGFDVQEPSEAVCGVLKRIKRARTGKEENRRLREENARLRAEVEELARVLKSIEYVYMPDREHHQCPDCNGDEPQESKPHRGGHYERCELAAALKRQA